MIVGEAPGEEETRKGEPFVGASGQELSRMLHEAGIMRSQCFLTNVSKERPTGNDIGLFLAMRKMDITAQHVKVRDKYVTKEIVNGISQLRTEIEMCRPNVIIAFGNLALWALTGHWGITSWRGSLLTTDLELGLDYRPKVIPTYHPAAVLRVWPWRPIVLNDLRRAKTQADYSQVIRAEYKFVVRPSYATALTHLQFILQALDKAPLKLATDIETRAGHIACIGFAWSKHEAICIPLMCVERPEGYWPIEEEASLCFLMYKILTHSNLENIGQNFIYDAQYIFRHWHFIPKLSRDTMTAQHACFSMMQKGLDFLSSMYCEDHVYWKDDSKDWDPKVGEDQLWIYNCTDAVRTFEIDEVEQKTVKTLGLQEPHDFQQSLYTPVLATMNRGIKPDVKRRGAYAMFLMDEIAKRESRINHIVGRPFNVRSPKQMQELFYQELNMRPIFNRKTRTLTCDDEALRALANREPLVRPLVQSIAELRSLGVFLSTFVQAPLDHDGRIRCSFNISGTETYRFSSSKNAFGSGLNLQNIPSGDEEDAESLDLQLPNIRQLFIPDDGCEFFDTDFNSADLRIVVWESDEGEMKAMLREGADIYTEVGKEFYHDPGFTKSDPRRNKFFKPFCHGTHYLGTAKGLAERLGISVHEADKTQQWYFGKFPGIKKWHKRVIDQVTKRHMVENIWGYRCYFFDRIEGTIFNQAVAWIPQSTIAVLVNKAYARIHKEVSQVEVLLQVHDSLAGQYRVTMRDAAKARIMDCFKIALPYADPLVIPAGIKTSTKSWGDCK